MTEDIWITQTNKRIPMSQMTEGHLDNALAWVDRKIASTTVRLDEPEVYVDEGDLIFRSDVVAELRALEKRKEMLVRERDRRWCVLHSDCRANRELGRSCVLWQPPIKGVPVKRCTQCGRKDGGVTVQNRDAANITHWWHPACWAAMRAWLSAKPFSFDSEKTP
jgi:hypothetical protein